MAKYSKHHIIPSSNQYKFNGNLYVSDNIIKIRDTMHTNLHRLFSNKTPQEQLEQMYYINKKVLSDTSIKLFETLINMRQDKFYKIK